MKTITNLILISIAVITILSVTAVVEAQKGNEIATNSAKQSIDYPLPYPGILPGNPLYPLKMLRDKIVSMFISDPVKKAEFYLLMTDKRINAGIYLINYNKVSLGEPTINKGQNYFDQALDLVGKVKKDGNVVILFDRMEKANLKHQEVLEEVLIKVPDNAKPGIRNAIERAKKAADQIQKIKK